jgi:hypothetical protein
MIQTSYDLEDAPPGSHLLSHGEESRERGDGVHDFMLLLADIYRTYPDLWQNEELKCVSQPLLGMGQDDGKLGAFATRIVL